MAGRHDQRVAKVEHSLAPKQAVILWMEEAHKLGSMHQYALSLKGKPDSAFPLVKLPKQVETAVRDSMKGQRREWVDRYAERAVKGRHLSVQAPVPGQHRPLTGEAEAGNDPRLAL